jgi:membrane protease YdiL (CAAX protease family)
MKLLTQATSLASGHPIATFLVAGNAIFLLASIGPRLEAVLELPIASALGTILGVTLVAFLVTAAAEGRAGVDDLVRRSLLWRVPLRWYLFVLFLTPVATACLALGLYGVSALEAPPEGWPDAAGAFLAVFAIQLLLFNLPEEIGWTGFLQERLRSRYSALGLAAVVALFWTIWHVPEFFADEGWSAENLLPALVFLCLEFVLLFFARVVLIWIYCRTGLSVLMVALFHAATNATFIRLSAVLIPDSDGVRFAIVSGVIFVTAAAVIVPTRGRFSDVREGVTPRQAVH